MSTRLRRLTTVAALTAATTLIVAGCGSNPTSTPASSSPESATSSASTSPLALAQKLSPEDSSAQDPAGTAAANTAPKTLLGNTSAPAQLVVSDIRVGEYQGKDRVVFQFAGTGTPGYSADYVDSPVQQGSGRPLDLSGASFLQVNMDGQVIPTGGELTEVPVGTVSAEASAGLSGVAFAGQFEGRAQAVIGLKGERKPFTAFTLSNPTRLVVDVAR